MNKIGRYRIRGLLGRGHMSKVYKVEIPVIGKIAALKLLDPDPLLAKLMGREEMKRLFISEAVTQAGLRHPNIVEIWDFGEVHGKPFYIMDFYFNNLGDLIGEPPDPQMPSRVIKLDKAVDYTRQTLRGLACLHHAGIVHRDIKPFNILLTEQDLAKICDFGLSKLRGEAFSGPRNLKVGSPGYAAPEQEDDPDRADFRADVYAVGIMLYRMLTGGLPTENFKMASSINPDLDQDWDFFINRAIAPNRRYRYAGANEMLAAMEDLFSAWSRKSNRICRLRPDPVKGLKKADSGRVRLRSRGIKVGYGQAAQKFPIDALWRPRRYIQNDFQTANDQIVTDRSTGLVWQRAGSAYPMTWIQARAYIGHLNESGFNGRICWRLPTVEELLSLLTETPHGTDFCIEPVFDHTRKWLWSADRCSYTSAWYANAEMGFVGRQDMSALFYARGVCDAPVDG